MYSSELIEDRSSGQNTNNEARCVKEIRKSPEGSFLTAVLVVFVGCFFFFFTP